jgi:hypothetical protein
MTKPQEQPEGLFPISEALPVAERGDMTSVERMQYFVETLDLFDKVADIEGTIRRFNNSTWRHEQEEKKGKPGVYIWRRRLNEQHQETLDTAKQTFFQGYTAEEKADFGADEQEITDELTRRYEIFENAYRGTSQARIKKREEARQNYQLHIEASQDNAELNTPLTRQLVASTGNVAVQNTLEPELAKTKDKLIGLRDDARAGFIPTTHTEKNQAFEILDYMNLAKYPKGVTTRLTEIFIKQQRDGKELGLQGNDLYEYGLQSITSITHEWADHLHSAMLSHAELVKLKELLDSGINPHISTLEALETEPDKLYDYNVLVRFANLKSLRDGGAFQYDPLRTREDRSLIHPDKNKIIEDVHTELGSVVQIQDFIDQAASELNVKDGRVLINEAITDQANRRLFWYRALREVADYQGKDRHDEGFQAQARQALKVAGAPSAA